MGVVEYFADRLAKETFYTAKYLPRLHFLTIALWLY